MLFAADPSELTGFFVELGIAILGLAMLGRLAHHAGVSAIPLYLLGGLAFGNGGLLPLHFTEKFVHLGSETGVILLLFMLGLEYSAAELQTSLRSGLSAGVFDLLFNFPPGLIAGLMLGSRPLPDVLLGGVAYISSSGIIARSQPELNRLNNPETSAVLSVLV